MRWSKQIHMSVSAEPAPDCSIVHQYTRGRNRKNSRSVLRLRFSRKSFTNRTTISSLRTKPIRPVLAVYVASELRSMGIGGVIVVWLALLTIGFFVLMALVFIADTFGIGKENRLKRTQAKKDIAQYQDELKRADEETNQAKQAAAVAKQTMEEVKKEQTEWNRRFSYYVNTDEYRNAYEEDLRADRGAEAQYQAEKTVYEEKQELSRQWQSAWRKYLLEHHADVNEYES